MNGRALVLEFLLLREEVDEGRADGDDVVGSADHKVELFLPDGSLANPRRA